MQKRTRRVSDKLETTKYTPEVEVSKDDEIKPFILGIATTRLNVRDGVIEKGETVGILKDNGDQWLTEKGLVPKLYLLLKKIKG